MLCLAQARQCGRHAGGCCFPRCQVAAGSKMRVHPDAFCHFFLWQVGMSLRGHGLSTKVGVGGGGQVLCHNTMSAKPAVQQRSGERRAGAGAAGGAGRYEALGPEMCLLTGPSVTCPCLTVAGQVPGALKVVSRLIWHPHTHIPVVSEPQPDPSFCAGCFGGRGSTACRGCVWWWGGQVLLLWVFFGGEGVLLLWGGLGADALRKGGGVGVRGLSCNEQQQDPPVMQQGVLSDQTVTCSGQSAISCALLPVPCVRAASARGSRCLGRSCSVAGGVEFRVWS